MGKADIVADVCPPAAQKAPPERRVLIKQLTGTTDKLLCLFLPALLTFMQKQ